MGLKISLFALLVELNLMDYFLTEVALRKGGEEPNPLARVVYVEWGMRGIAIVKIMLLILMGMTLQYIQIWVVIAFIILYCYLVYLNRNIFWEML